MGYFRFLAALAVVLFHLADISGGTGVFAFYTLAGFLTVYLRSEIYTPENRGALRFVAARFLRIYPAYWACLAISILLVWSAGMETARSVHPSMYLPSTTGSWLRQVGIFGLLNFPYGLYHVRIMPTAWCLTIILAYYLIVGLLVGSSYRRAKIFFAIACAITLGGRLLGVSYTQLFLSIPGSALPFAVGAMAYHLARRRMKKDYRPPLPLLAAYMGVQAALFFVPEIAGFGHTLMAERYRYLMPFTCAPLIALLHQYFQQVQPSALNRWLGEISYPVFLLHWPVALLVGTSLLGSLQDSLPLALLSLAVSCGIAAGIVFAVERPLLKLRRKLRKNATSGSVFAAMRGAA